MVSLILHIIQMTTLPYLKIVHGITCTVHIIYTTYHTYVGLLGCPWYHLHYTSYICCFIRLSMVSLTIHTIHMLVYQVVHGIAYNTYHTYVALLGCSWYHLNYIANICCLIRLSMVSHTLHITQMLLYQVVHGIT